MTSNATIRSARDEELDTVADFFRAMWLDSGQDRATLREDWADVVAAFVARARSEAEFAAFVAEVDGAIVGCAACQVFAGLYPEIRLPSAHRAGYIWGVYVRPEHRRRSLATALTRAAVGHLQSIGCKRVNLHASLQGDPVYRAMGFTSTNERALVLED